MGKILMRYLLILCCLFLFSCGGNDDNHENDTPNSGNENITETIDEKETGEKSELEKLGLDYRHQALPTPSTPVHF